MAPRAGARYGLVALAVALLSGLASGCFGPTPAGPSEPEPRIEGVSWKRPDAGSLEHELTILVRNWGASGAFTLTAQHWEQWEDGTQTVSPDYRQDHYLSANSVGTYTVRFTQISSTTVVKVEVNTWVGSVHKSGYTLTGP